MALNESLAKLHYCKHEPRTSTGCVSVSVCVCVCPTAEVGGQWSPSVSQSALEDAGLFSDLLQPFHTGTSRQHTQTEKMTTHSLPPPLNKYTPPPHLLFPLRLLFAFAAKMMLLGSEPVALTSL